MKVRLLKPWKYRKVGTILAEVPDGVANVLIRRKIVEVVAEPQLIPQEKTERPKRVGR